MFFLSPLLLLISVAIAFPHPNEKITRQFGQEPATQRFPRAPSFIFSGDAPYGARKGQLSSILNCPNGQPSASTNTVLLVHGTGSTGYESWAHGYVPALTAAGYTACYVSLRKFLLLIVQSYKPEDADASCMIANRSSGDVQLSSAYVAYNMHLVSSLSGGKPISVIGHSQGGPNIQWALRFFPSTRNVVKTYVGLSPDLGPGTTYFRTECDAAGQLGACTAATWQQATNSNFYAALNYKNKAFVESTLIWTSADQIVTPPEPNAQLPGATTIQVQTVCPNQMPDHFAQLINPTTYAIALDALANGYAVASRIPQSACVGNEAPGMDITIPCQCYDY